MATTVEPSDQDTDTFIMVTLPIVPMVFTVKGFKL